MSKVTYAKEYIYVKKKICRTIVTIYLQRIYSKISFIELAGGA